MKLIDMLLETKDYITLAQLAQMHDVSKRAVYGWLKAKIAPDHVYEFGGYFFHKQSAQAYVPPYKRNGLKTGKRKKALPCPQTVL